MTKWRQQVPTVAGLVNRGLRELQCAFDQVRAERDEARQDYDDWRGRYNEAIGECKRLRAALAGVERDEARAAYLTKCLAVQEAEGAQAQAEAERDRLRASLSSAAVGLGQSRVDRITELEEREKTLLAFGNAALEHQRAAEARVAALEQALGAVEFIDSGHYCTGRGHGLGCHVSRAECAWCGRCQKCGHAPDCPRQRALGGGQ